MTYRDTEMVLYARHEEAQAALKKRADQHSLDLSLMEDDLQTMGFRQKGKVSHPHIGP